MTRQSRPYIGKLQGVILDWAGTTVDFGCFAPTMVFVEGFRAHGVDITMDEAREPMGKFKRDHIQAILQMPRVASLWQSAHGHLPTNQEVQMLFDEFIPRQLAVIARYSDPISGVLETIAHMRARGLKIGSCTGYTRAMMDVLIPQATAKGYTADTVVTFDEVGSGRPAPFMAFENARRLNIYPMEAIVKIGDTVADIEEGLNAAMWTIGLAKTGNELGLTEAEIASLDPQIVQDKLAHAYEKLNGAGAHYVVDSLANVMPILDDIEEKLRLGQKP